MNAVRFGLYIGKTTKMMRTSRQNEWEQTYEENMGSKNQYKEE